MKDNTTILKTSKSPSVMMILFARPYSTRKAISLLYKWHIQNDGESSGEDMHAWLIEEQQSDKHFLYEAIDWSKVKDYLQANLREVMSGVIKK